MARFFIARPVFAIVTALLLVLAGSIAGLSLPVAQYPQITLPTVRVEASYPGANALVVEESVGQPVEAQVNGVEGMLYMESIAASNGRYQLDVTFALDRNPDLAAVQVQNRVSQANAQLPSEVQSAGITTRKTTPDTLMYVVLHSPQGSFDDLFLTNYANIYVVETLKRLKGVGNVQVFGSEFGMRIWLRPDRMAQLAVTTTDIANAVKEQNLQAPAGQVGQHPAPASQQFQLSVLVRGRLVQPKEFESIVVRANPDGSFVRLRDVARVELAAKDYTFVSRYNGRPAAAFAINLTPDASAIETAGLIHAAMADMAHYFPADLAYDTVVDNTVFVKESLREVVQTLLEALLLVLVVVALFLQNWRATLIPMLAVPVSLLGTFAVFSVLGFTINTLTLFGMVLAIGIVVDDAIVVVEAVEHHIERGLTPLAATTRAMEEVSGPVIAIALVLCAVFVPVAFLGGISGALYRQFAVTVAVSTLLSAFVALSLTPALCALMLAPHSGAKRGGPAAWFFERFNAGFEWLVQRYGSGVAAAIRRLALSLALLAVFLAGSFALMRSIPSEFVPPEDQGYFVGLVLLPEGASMNRTLASAQKVERSLAQTPGVVRVLTVGGYNILNGSPASNAALFVAALEPWALRQAPGKDLRSIVLSVFESALAMPEAQVLAFNPPPIPGLGSTGGFSFKLQDRHNGTPHELWQVASEFLAAAGKRPEIGIVYSKFDPNTPAYQIDVDREKTKKLGIAVSDVSSTLQAFLGGIQVNDFSRFGRTFKVTLQAEPEFRGDIAAIRQFHVRSAAGEMVPLSTLLQARETDAPATVQRYNLFREADIGGTPAFGYSSGQAIAALEEVAREVLPPGYAYEWSGLSRQELESAGRSNYVFALALVFVFLFLAALYESWSIPFAVLLAVPLGILGAMLGLKATGLTNNIYAQIGMILLIGLAAKNAILIVEFANARRMQGMGAIEAAIEAAKLRLRPILMTSFAFILGVVPLVLARGAGAHARVSMGITVVCGMVAATVLAIFLVPVLFVALDRLAERLRGRASSLDQAVAPGGAS